VGRADALLPRVAPGVRSDVGPWYVAWERLIPFVPLMLVPSMSLDLPFVAAPVVCRDRPERQTRARRISLDIVAAGAGFLPYPLRLGFDRPTVSGPLGALFVALPGLIGQDNLLPSLHITLRTILADLCARHTRGLTQVVAHVWWTWRAASSWRRSASTSFAMSRRDSPWSKVPGSAPTTRSVARPVRRWRWPPGPGAASSSSAPRSPWEASGYFGLGPVGAHLLASGHARTADEAVGIRRRARPALVVRPETYGALREFAMAGVD
jgi:hypothetical protein